MFVDAVQHTVSVTPTLLGLAAFITALCGVVTTILAFRKSRSEQNEALREDLEKARAHEERAAYELHEVKMAHPELFPPPPPEPEEQEEVERDDDEPPKLPKLPGLPEPL
jgi:hypothetical protein